MCQWFVQYGEVCVGQFGGGFCVQFLIVGVEFDMVEYWEVEVVWGVLVFFFDIV